MLVVRVYELLVQKILRRENSSSIVDGIFDCLWEDKVSFFEELLVELFDAKLFLCGGVFEPVDLELLLSESDLELVNLLFQVIVLLL